MNSILITGTNRGIGLEMVKHYVKDGWRVFACCHSPRDAHELIKIKQKNTEMFIFPLDVTSPESIEALVAQLGDAPIDILVNNAGILIDEEQPFGTIKSVQWLETLKINTLAPLLIAQALISLVTKSKLKIIANISSTMGSIADNTSGGYYMYRSSKAALNAVTKSMAIDLKEKGIKVVVLHPGWVKTDMGGLQALITPEESVCGMKEVLRTLSHEQSGNFLRYSVHGIAW